MAKSATLRSTESAQQSGINKMAGSVDATVWLDQDTEIEPIQCHGDYLAIAPLQPDTMTSGGIVMATSTPTNLIGVVVGVSKDLPTEHLDLLGKQVFYNSQSHIDATRKFKYYGDVRIDIVRYNYLFAEI